MQKGISTKKKKQLPFNDDNKSHASGGSLISGQGCKES